MIPCDLIPTHINVITKNKRGYTVARRTQSSRKHIVLCLSIVVWFIMIYNCRICAQVGHGTSIVFDAKDTVVYMGADSWFAFGDDNVTEDCKIVACKNKMIGIVGTSGGPGHFVPRTEILKVMKRFPRYTIAQIVMKLDSSCRAFIREAIRDGHPIKSTTIGFLGCEYVNKRFEYTTVSYFYDTTHVQPEVRMEKTHIDNFQNKITWAGYDDSIRAILKLNRHIWELKPVARIEMLIKSEAAKNPWHVGGPIDIIQLTRRGLIWVSHKQECKICDE
jgi:hypothetical protein